MALVLLAGCAMRSTMYRPASDKVYLVPAGSRIIAPENKTIGAMDDSGADIRVSEVLVEADGALIGESEFLELVKKAGEKKAE